MSKTAIEIEVDTEHNNNVLFQPLQRSIRGRFSFDRAAKHEKNWHLVSAGWPDMIPGQRIGFDAATGEGYILEPLHAPDHEGIAERVKAQAMKLAPEREAVKLTDQGRADWLWAMKCLTDHGIAKLVKGEFPREVAPPTPKPATLDPIDRLATAIEGLLEKLAPKRALA
ncbi:MAG: hypothetical protein AB7O62_08560 [Pirellulales bacterium]